METRLAMNRWKWIDIREEEPSIGEKVIVATESGTRIQVAVVRDHLAYLQKEYEIALCWSDEEEIRSAKEGMDMIKNGELSCIYFTGMRDLQGFSGSFMVTDIRWWMPLPDVPKDEEVTK